MKLISCEKLEKSMAELQFSIDAVSYTHLDVYKRQALDEPYTAEPTYTYEGMDFPLTVPDNCLFLMGDNRNGSKDSRSTDIGCVDTRDILGTALWLSLIHI